MYLGVPLSLSRLRRCHEQPLVDAIAARIPTWKAGLLNLAGRSLLTKVTLLAIPVHISIAASLSSWAIQQIDKRCRAFLWAGTESVAAGKCKVAWPVVCSPQIHGGLGLLDLRPFGHALRLHWEWLRCTDSSRAWSSLPAKAKKCMTAMFNASVSIRLGDGNYALFWSDRWLQAPLSSLAPSLFAAISRTGRRRTVKDALFQRCWVRDIRGVLTVQVLLEYIRV